MTVAGNDSRIVGKAAGWVAGQTAESMPRYAIVSATAPVAGRVHLTRIHLAPGSYTTVTMQKGSTAGSGSANVFFGVYPIAGGAPLGSSSNQATALDAVSANALFTVTVNATIATDADYWIALLYGSGTPPTLAQMSNSTVAGAVLVLAPALSADHNPNSGLSALPNPLVTQTAGSARPWWVRYE